MARIGCNCGEAFSTSASPCRYQFRLIPDTALEDLVENGLMTACDEKDRSERVLLMYHAISVAGPEMFKCPHCGRLIVYWSKDNPVGQSYAPEPEPSGPGDDASET